MTDNRSDLLNDACIDVYPASDTQSAPHGALELGLPNNSLWDSGRALDFAFLGGNEDQKRQFRAAASQWTEHTNLIMKFDQPADSSEFRVDFKNEGNWSYVGNANLTIASPAKTMNIQNMKSILHEVGHAIGCIHEHSSPASNIQWNKPVVYQALGGPPNNWNQAKVDHNVFAKYSGTTTQFSAFDPDSIMLYFFPASWTLNGVGTHANDVLSATDKAFARRCYPGCTVDFSKADIAAAACKVSVGPRTMFNQNYGNSWLMNQPNASFIEVRFNQPKNYAGLAIYSAARLRIVHLTSMNWPKAGNSPVDIIVNGQMIKQNYSPPSGDYMTDVWDITNALADGDNVIRINFKNAQTNYWINSLKVECDRILR